MNPEKEHQLIYDRLSKDLNLKFKSQINGSGIKFQKYLFVTNLITGKETNTVIIQDYKHPIIYQTRKEFIELFIIYLRWKMDELNKEFEELNSYTSKSNFYDENYVFMEHERIGSEGNKAQQLLKRFHKFKAY